MHNWTLTARYVFPVAGPPLANGVVVVAGERIAAVEPPGRRADVDLGNVAVVPGFVNAHTHLDLTGLRGRCPPTPDFTRWLRGVIAHRRTQTPEQIDRDISAGLAECLAAGTTLVGDIAAAGASWETLAKAPVRAVVFRELLGLPRERAQQAWRDLLLWQTAHPATETCRPGVSPHAPYSVHLGVVRAAAWNGWPVAIHLAETREELQLLASRSGPFRDFLESLGVWEPAGLAKSAAEVLRRSRRSPCPLYVHGNYLPVDSPIPAHGTVIYCPRTHAAFGHPPHPFRAFLDRGVRVALGTDSLASNPDLDLLAEARFLRSFYPDLAGAALLRVATLSGAEALGWADVTGSLEPGKSADLAVVPLPDADAADPHDLLFGGTAPAARTLFRGRWTAPEHPAPAVS
jgi:cytosine/adenosine deaminase-related metal-dependent hydrolase